MQKLSIICLLVSLVPMGIVGADVIVVSNAGFESPPRAEADFGPAEAWTEGYYDLAEPGTWVIEGLEGGGNWNPDDVDGFTGGAAFAGEHVGWASAATVGDGGLSQILTEPLLANTEYVLTVQVGNSLYNAGVTADYRLELLAGGILLASSTGGPPATDTWEMKTLTYISGSDHEQLGQRLEIRLIAVEFPESDDHELEFDEVSLSASPSTPFVIEEIVYEPDSNVVTLTWSSREGASYAVKVSTDMSNWDADLDDGVEADPGESTSRSFALGEIGDDGGEVFFRIEQL